jgi:formylglycine-generating enzyme required for sulfatase activity
MDQPNTHRLSGYGIIQSTMRIDGGKGTASGAGVAVSPRHIATCTHVVLDALGLENNDTLPQGQTIDLTVWRDSQAGTCKARTMPNFLPVEAGDIALLELLADEVDLVPAALHTLRADQWANRKVGVCGFPKGFDAAGNWTSLTCHNPTQDGRVQCSPAREGIDKGHSGGPVFDDQGNLLGIAQAYRHFTSRDLKYDYIIPSIRIGELLPHLCGVNRQPYFELRRVLYGETPAPTPELLAQVREVSPHVLAEYCLYRRAEDWDTRDIHTDFTPLWMLLEERRRDREQGAGPHPERLNNLQQALAKEPPVYLFKGAPGSGKSTLLKRLAFDLTEKDEPPLLPIYIQLGGHRDSRSPGQWLAASWEEQFPDMPPLAQMQREHRLLWLLDGLNELPDEAAMSRTRRIEAWRDWLTGQTAKHRAIISCRSADYLGKLDNLDQVVVPHLELEPLGLETIRDFLGQCSDLNSVQVAAAVEKIAQWDLVRLYNTPLMLTLLEDVLTPAGEFPNRRADLFQHYLCRLVTKEHAKPNNRVEHLFDADEIRDMQDVAEPLLPRDAPLFAALSRVAFDKQKAEIRGESQEVFFDRRDLKAQLKTHTEEQLGGEIWGMAWALNLLVDAESRKLCRFRHQQFQEFFAALRLALNPAPELVRAPPHPEKRFAETLEKIRSRMENWQELPEVERTGWEETALMAAELAEPGDTFVTDLASENLPLAGLCADRGVVSTDTRRRLEQQLLARMRDGSADLRARIAAGKALGEMGGLEVLGYQAKRDGQGVLIAWLPPVEPMPEGEYTFGSEKGDPDAYDNEQRFNQLLVGFEMGRYPVTNAEWACFIRAKGYENPDYWPGEAAQSYRERGSNEGQIQTWHWWREQYESDRLDKSLEDSSLDLDTREMVREKVSLAPDKWEDHLAQLRAEAKPVTEPDYWRLSRYNNPLQPVVGISLFEALAYCRWLSEITDTPYTLPDELQWEAAARGSGNQPRRYAWGDDFHQDYCNSRDAEGRIQVGAPTPVGLYEQGKTPDQVLYDMTGNCWEWTRSAYRKNPPYDNAELPRLEDASQPRVVRGGGWLNIRRDVRAAFRLNFTPDLRSSLLGCRVCVVPPLNPET